MRQMVCEVCVCQHHPHVQRGREGGLELRPPYGRASLRRGGGSAKGDPDDQLESQACQDYQDAKSHVPLEAGLAESSRRCCCCTCTTYAVGGGCESSHRRSLLQWAIPSSWIWVVSRSPIAMWLSTAQHTFSCKTREVKVPPSSAFFLFSILFLRRVCVLYNATLAIRSPNESSLDYDVVLV